ncbi:ABC transporter substrate-binding protein [Paenibacillus sp. 32352]|uniref:ABC transporter substrate-binding protein n=1 Tax=Paenibacillus sp. 32352 TaxID=1969111 RepID=UPI0009AED184|nr:extracellular solute-binding protein [Paenibacillus sp. 32352]
MKHSIVITALTIALLSGMTAGCGGGASPDAEGKTAKEIDFNAPLEFTLTSSGATSPENFHLAVTQFLQKKFPNWKFNYIQRTQGTTAQELVTAGTAIDVVLEAHTGIIDGVINPGIQYDISDLIKKNNIDLNRFEPVTIDAMKTMANGQIWGLPVSMMSVVTFYNKDIFDKFGVPYPKDGMTWDEMTELSKKLSKEVDGTQYLGLVGNTGHMLLMNNFSLPYVDAQTSKSTFHNEKWKTIMETVFKGEAQDSGFKKYLTDNKNKMPGKDEFIKKKNLAMYVYFSELATDPNMQGMNFDMVSAPTYKELPNVGFQPIPTYAILASTSKHKEESMEIIKYLASDEYQMARAKLGFITPLKSEEVRKSMGADYSKKLNWNAVFYKPFAPIPVKGAYENIGEKPLVSLVPDYVLGNKDVNTVMREAEETANKAIDSARK